MKKELIRVGQNVDEAWMNIGQYLIKSWSAFKAKEVGQKLDESWMEFHPFRICQGYANDMPEFRFNKLLQPYSSITPKIEGYSLKRVSQQLPNDYLENKGCSLNKSGQNRYGIGTENCVKVSSWVRQFEGFNVGQFLGETWVDLLPFYLEMNLVIQPLSFITHSLIVHNKRASYGYTKVTPGIHQEFSLFDIARLFLYVVLPDQNL